MAAGQLNKMKVGFIIQARMKSTRLPNKVMMSIPFLSGKPIVEWIIDALNESKFNNQVIIATSTHIENNILEEFAIQKRIECFRGDESNVLSRFIELAKKNSFDVIVRLTADNPIIDIKILDDTILKHIENKNDYSKTEGLPIGMNFEIVNPAALLQLEKEDLSEADKEHVTLFIRNNAKFKRETIKYYQGLGYDKLRLTIDYPSDFIVLSTILSQVTKDNQAGMNLIMNTLNENSWVFDGNHSNFQKKQFSSETEEVAAAIEFLEINDFKKAAAQLKKLRSE